MAIVKNKTSQKKFTNPVVLIHGSWSSSYMWSLYTDYLREAGWDVYAPDLKGHGADKGTIAGTTMNDYVASVRNAVVEKGLENPIIIGHSMGGLIALMYVAQYGAHNLVAIDPSPSKEVQGGERKEYPAEYSMIDAGLPSDPQETIKMLPDISKEVLMQFMQTLGMDSGVARSERKLGISVPREKLSMPTLFVGGELGESVSFGIGIRVARTMATYYGKEVIEIKRATHPGILIGEHAPEAVKKIEVWLQKQQQLTH